MQAQAAVAQTSVATPQGPRLAQASVPKGQPHSTSNTYMNKEVRHLRLNIHSWRVSLLYYN